MEEQLLYYFKENQSLAVIISVLLNIIVSILGLIPSFFITAANIAFFGLWKGTLISFYGEVLGAAISFLIYRKGLKQIIYPHVAKYPRLMRLINSDGGEAVYLILLLRIMPLMPSGLVTLAASMGKVSFFTFTVASSLGKVPALLIEAFSAVQFIKIDWLRSWSLELLLVYMFYRLWRRIKK